MKKYATYILLLLTYPCFGQSKHKPPPPRGNDDAAGKVRWETKHPYKYSDIQKEFPFNQSTSVLLVAFIELPEEKPDTVDANGHLIPEPPHEGVDTLGHKSVLEIVALTEAQVQQLGAIFFNLICSEGRVIGSCYEPRNAIVFLDKNAHVAAEFELCFQCHNFRVSPRDFHIGRMCPDEYDALQQFFVKAGIKYGATKQKR